MNVSKNKSYLFAGLLLSILTSTSAALAEPASGLSQTLDIQGEITGGGCSVNFPTSITFADTDITKLISSSSASGYDGAFIAANVPVLTVTNCAASQQFTVTLLGTTDPDAPEALANDAASNKAEHVAMRMYEVNADETPFIPNVASSVFTVGTDGSRSVNIIPALVKTTDSPTAGDVHITGQFQINYL